jgi:hypothetical protein
VLSLNTVVYSTAFASDTPDPSGGTDPLGQWAWLEAQLEAVAAKGEAACECHPNDEATRSCAAPHKFYNTNLSFKNQP